jgi:glycosyltransferase involved in cell wall biosynthesis
VRIFGWAADAASGCWWYRIKLPLDALRDLGHETDYSPRMPPEWWDKPEVVIGQRVYTTEATTRWEQLAKRPDRPLMVYETDDDLLNIDPSIPNAYAVWSRPEVQDNMRRCIQLADLVTVSTEPLADVLRPLNPNIAVLPNYIPRRLLRHPLVPDPEPGGPTVIGWAGTPTHAVDFEECAAELCKFVLRTTNVHYYSMGVLVNGNPGLFASLEELLQRPDQVHLAGWFPLPYYYSALGFHIGLAPIRASTFNQSKSPIKAMEYAARGAAVIASNTGPYARYVRHGETGLLAARPQQWRIHLRTLVNDPAMRRELVAKAHAHVSTLTIEDHAHEWADAIRSHL